MASKYLRAWMLLLSLVTGVVFGLSIPHAYSVSQQTIQDAVLLPSDPGYNRFMQQEGYKYIKDIRIRLTPIVSPTRMPTPTQTHTPTPTPTRMPTPTVTKTPTPTPSKTPTPTPSSTSTPTPTQTPMPTSTPTPNPYGRVIMKIALDVVPLSGKIFVQSLWYKSGNLTYDIRSEGTVGSDGIVTVDIWNISQGTYDVTVKPAGFLQKKRTGIVVSASDYTIDFTGSRFMAGDVLGDNSSYDDIINAMDIGFLSSEWNTGGGSTSPADINRDGFVNGIDASYVIQNYLKSGEK